MNLPIHPLERLKTFRRRIELDLTMDNLKELNEIIEFMEQIEENK